MSRGSSFFSNLQSTLGIVITAVVLLPVMATLSHATQSLLPLNDAMASIFSHKQDEQINHKTIEDVNNI